MDTALIENVVAYLLFRIEAGCWTKSADIIARTRVRCGVSETINADPSPLPPNVGVSPPRATAMPLSANSNYRA